MDIRKRCALCIFGMTVLLPAAALATQPGWYVAVDGGQTQYSGISGDAQQWVLTTPLPAQGWVISGSDASLQRSESNDAGYRLSVGYQFNPYLSVEAGYVTLGKVHASGEGSLFLSPANGILPLEEVGTFTDAAQLQVRGWELAATGSWPLSPQWSLFGRVGIFDATTKLEGTSTPAPPYPENLIATSVSESNSNWAPTFGVGVNFSPVDHWAVRLGWNRYAHLGNRDTTGKFNVNLLSLGVVYTLWA